MKVATRYIALKGSRRRYYDMVRHEVISRRQYLKRHGVFPVSRGRGALGRVRSDKGCTRQSSWQGKERAEPFTRRVSLPDGQVAEVFPFGHLTFCIVVQHRFFAQVTVEQCGERRKWHCGTPGYSYVEKNQKKITLHCYQSHYHHPWEGIGKQPEVVRYTGEVRTNERRPRMPWVIPTQSRRPFFGKG